MFEITENKTSVDYYTYWGKAEKKSGAKRLKFHLLPYHCLDVASICWLLLCADSKVVQNLCRKTGLSSDILRYLIVLTMMMHDIGKFSKSFQSLVPEIFLAIFRGKGLVSYDERHDTLGFLLWRGDSREDDRSIKNLVEKNAPEIAPYIHLIIRVGTGHHGKPPKESKNGNSLRAADFFDEEDVCAAQKYVAACLSLLGDPPRLSKPVKTSRQALKAVSWLIAGFGVLADWLGSNDEYFPYCDERMPLDVYWRNHALPKAESALRSVRWKSTAPRPFKKISTMFPFIQTPTPLQKLAVDTSLFDGPKLFIVEDVTGAGKTEAAMVLASRIMGKGDAEGLYIGLPTMATANAMYIRMKKAYRAFYSRSESPSLILSHGARHLSSDFIETVGIEFQQHKAVYDEGANIVAFCNEWYADNRKKSLLADIGVGTIDQALMGVLPARHQSLRLLGLQRKVLIIDEVHAYDPYMEHLLSVLLEAHARGGGSAILLSATIPEKKREEFIASFSKGIDGDNIAAFPRERGFPLLTQVGNGKARANLVATRKEVQRDVTVEFIEDYESALSMVMELSEGGNCVCWIRNTVNDARKTYDDLIRRGAVQTRISLFHSRFAMVDRARIEKQTIADFGKTSTGEHRRGRILIATQVVEQSLDLDFDAMISDLAPIDLLIQRGGRLHRHVRDERGNYTYEEGVADNRPDPVFYVFAPVFSNSPEQDWLDGEFAGTAAVYQNEGVLWRSLRVLVEKQGWSMPGDARELIELVYGEGRGRDVPNALRRKVSKAENNDASKVSIGHLNTLDLSIGYRRSAAKLSLWDEDEKISTRLTEETTEIALAVEKNGALVPYAEVERHRWDWSCLSISIREWKKNNFIIPSRHESMVAVLLDKEPRLKYSKIVVVSRQSSSALKATKAISDFYCPRLGWGAEFEKEE